MPHPLPALPVSLRGLIGVFALVQLGWIALLGQHSWQGQKAELEKELLLNARFLAIASQATFDTVGAGLVDLSDRLTEGGHDPLHDPAAISPLLRQYQRYYPKVSAIGLVQPDGKVAAHSLYADPTQVRQAVPQAELAAEMYRYRSAPRGYALGSTSKGVFSDRWRLSLRQTRYRGDGRPAFYLHASIPIDPELPLWSDLGLPPSHAISLVRLDGSIVARWPAPDPDAIYNADPGTDLSKFLSSNISASREGSLYIAESVDHKERLAAFSRLDTLPLAAVASVDYSLITELWFTRNLWWFISGAVFLILTVLLFLRMTLLERRHHGELETASQTDPLTGLLNRRGCMDRLQACLARQENRQRPLTLLYLDLDNFKPINDKHGHDYGDDLLKQVAERIRAAIREGDLAARIGGDEFVVVLPDIACGEAEGLAERVLEQFERPFPVRELNIRMRTSIGYGCFPEHGHTIEDLLVAADRSMYECKNRGRQGDTHATLH
jgi:diguanylate cyclase (GGDEF)-like protein